jgi:hypothetical protein
MLCDARLQKGLTLVCQNPPLQEWTELSKNPGYKKEKEKFTFCRNFRVLFIFEKSLNPIKVVINYEF